jgi:hypothetical protein
LLKNNFFIIYFILEKVWKIIHDNDKDLTEKSHGFFEFLNCFLKEKSVDYVHDAMRRVHGADSPSIGWASNLDR